MLRNIDVHIVTIETDGGVTNNTNCERHHLVAAALSAELHSARLWTNSLFLYLFLLQTLLKKLSPYCVKKKKKNQGIQYLTAA